MRSNFSASKHGAVLSGSFSLNENRMFRWGNSPDVIVLEQFRWGGGPALNISTWPRTGIVSSPQLNQTTGMEQLPVLPLRTDRLGGVIYPALNVPFSGAIDLCRPFYAPSARAVQLPRHGAQNAAGTVPDLSEFWTSVAQRPRVLVAKWKYSIKICTVNMLYDTI